MHAFIVAFTSLTDIVFSENGVLSNIIDTLCTIFAVKHRFFGVFRLKNPEISYVCRIFDHDMNVGIIFCYFISFTILASTPFTNEPDLSVPYFFESSTASLITTAFGAVCSFSSYVASNNTA